MRKSVFLITRYSVVGKAQHTWNLARDASSHSDYKAQVLAPERLRSRLAVFSAVTIPSVCQQASKVDLHWVILIAADLPTEQLSELTSALQPVEKAGAKVSLVKVADSDEGADIEHGIHPGMGMAARLAITDALDGTPSMFASVRLDDDDALAANYLIALSAYLQPQFGGKHISFPLGIQAAFIAPGKALVDARVVDKPLIALGLAFINSFDGKNFAAPEVHVLNFGNHNEVIEKTTVVSDRSLLAYLRVLTPTSDLGDDRQPRHQAATKAEIRSLGMPFRIRPAKKRTSR